mmetsp:Transcript_2906/g.11453  ORF Transcript_2906/g.11453 Transcript_2906/m.11453 type:complete len:458 (-) Transcript_2906:54-1427(-)
MSGFIEKMRATSVKVRSSLSPGNPPSPGGSAGVSPSAPSEGSAETSEDAVAALNTARNVNAQLGEEVRTLTVRLESAEADKAALEKLHASLGESLKKERESNLSNAQTPSATATDREADEPAVSGGEGGDDDGPDSVFRDELPALVRDGESAGWLADVSDVKLGDVLGQGSSGVTMMGKWKGQPLAVKRVNVSGKSRAVSFLREVKILAQLRHPHVLPFYAACLKPPDHCLLLTDYCTGATLKEWLYPRDGSNPPSTRRRLRIGFQIARGMRYLESLGIMHRDLKPSNVFLTHPGKGARAVIADFGLARPVPDPKSESVLTGETGTYVYMAPEVIRHEKYTGAADVYSFGVLLNELASGFVPYSNAHYTPVQVAFGVADRSLRPELASGVDPGLVAVIVSSWSQDPTERPTFVAVTDALDAMARQLVADDGEVLGDVDDDAGGGGLAGLFKGMFGGG